MRYKKTQISSLMNSEIKINKQIEYFTNEIETLKKKQVEILDMKNSIKEMKSEILSLGIRAD